VGIAIMLEIRHLKTLTALREHGSLVSAANDLCLTPSAISHQLRILKQNRLVKNRRDGKSVFYSLADSHVKTIISQGMEHIQE
jgi:ArsR family transcriptional regulator